MKTAKIFFVIIAMTMAVSGYLLFSKVTANTSSADSIISQISNQLKSWQENYSNIFKVDITRQIFVEDIIPSPSPNSSPTPNPTSTPSPKLTPKNSSSKPTIPPTTQKTCYSMRVLHLDGSSSTLCYTKNDADALYTLLSQFSSAKSSFSFYQSVADSYYESADKFNSDFFRKAGDEAAVKAKAEEQKMGEISLQMYAIEQRGW